MVHPGRRFRKANGIPRRVLRASQRTPEARALFAASVQKARDLADELGLMNPAARLGWRLAFD
jgi:hypothetical protein